MIYYKAGFKYQLTRDFSCQIGVKPVSQATTKFLELSVDGWLLIKAGYAWDGPSGPMMDTPSAMRGSLVHDALYQLMRMGLLAQDNRVPSDKEFRKLCKEDGMCAFRAWYAYKALQFANGEAAKPKHIKEERTAP